MKPPTPLYRSMIGLVLALALGGCAVYGPAGERPMTVKEQVYQAGGVLLGVGQELEFAIQTGAIRKDSDTARQLVRTYDVAFQVYRRAAALTLSDEHAAGTARLELLRLIDTLRRDLTAALVKP